MSDRKIAFWFIALLSVLVLVPFLGETIFYSKGEPREAIVAYTMLESGNWILPMNYGVEIAYKPPFLYWTIAVISSVLGGVSEFSARMPSALAFLAMQLVFFSFVAKRKDVKTAFLTSILLLSSFEVHRAAVACRLDMLQVSLIVISLCLLFFFRFELFVYGGNDKCQQVVFQLCVIFQQYAVFFGEHSQKSGSEF